VQNGREEGGLVPEVPFIGQENYYSTGELLCGNGTGIFMGFKEGIALLSLILTPIIKSNSYSLFHDFINFLEFGIACRMQQFEKNHFRAGQMRAGIFHGRKPDIPVFFCT